MNTKSKYLIAVSMLIAGTVFLGATQTFATDSFDRYPNFMQRLVQRFGLNESDVKSFFDEERDLRQKEMSTKYENILDQAIKDGKLTEDQKTALIEKRAELQKNREATLTEKQIMTVEERRTKMEAERTALIAWAKNKGIDIQYLMGKGAGRGMHGFRGM